MMNAVIELALSLLEQLLPQLGVANAPLVEKIVEALVALTPVLVKEYQDVLPMVKNVITALKGNTSITADQLTALESAETQLDASFEQAATAAQAEDTGSS